MINKILLWLVIIILLIPLVLIPLGGYLCQDQLAWESLNKTLSSLKANRKQFAYIVVLLDRTSSLQNDGQVSRLFDAYKDNITQKLLLKLGMGDKLTIYFIDDKCSFNNYLVQADEIPSFATKDVINTLNRVFIDPDLINDYNTKAIIEEIERGKIKVSESINSVQGKLQGATINNNRRTRTDIYCAFNEFAKLLPSEDYEKWLYVFSDFWHEARDSRLNDRAKDVMAIGEWNIIFISNKSTQRNANQAQSTINELENAIQDKSNYKNIQIGDLDSSSSLPGNNPTKDWEKLKNYHALGLIESIKTCFGFTSTAP